MNTELLKRVSENIVAHPTSFKMSMYFSFGNSSQRTEDVNVLLHNLNRSCGTTACIAGWTLALSGADLRAGHYHERAAKLLGIDEIQADRLFHAGNWPDEFRHEWYRTGDPNVEASIARRRIAHFIERNGDESEDYA